MVKISSQKLKDRWKEYYQKNKTKILEKQRKVQKARQFITKEIKQMQPEEVLNRIGFEEL